MRLEFKSFAKINLVLEILARRDDGYHELETVLQQLKLCDTIYLEELPSGRIEFFCDDPGLPAGEENLAYKAAQLIKKIAPQKGVRIELFKKIPVAAGLGGGSSNAAAVLLGLNKLWELSLGEPLLFRLAAELGSDVPFFIWGGTALAKGRGEVIYSLPSFPATNVLVVIPRGLQLKAAAVYNALDLNKITSTSTSSVADFLQHLKDGENAQKFQALVQLLCNHLETAVFSLEEEVLILKNRLLQKKLPALVAGSGPAVFALSLNEGKLEEAKRELEKEGYETILTETVQINNHILVEGGDT